jgi:pimeloyl-ACP methyl ester carboxylesterase
MPEQKKRWVGTSVAVVGLMSVGLLPLASPVSATTETTDQQSTKPKPPAPAIPKIDWASCGKSTALCATVKVPLDYRDPTGPMIDLAVANRPADDQEHKIGALFFDNGGPGGPNVPTVRDEDGQQFSEELRARYDIIGIDPRGVGESTPINCFATPEARASFFKDYGTFPVGEDEFKQYAAKSKEFGRQCGANAGPLLSHVTTANVARDYDLVRQAVGDPKLSYIGVSYGTYLGAVLANLYPDNVRGIVTDGNIDPTQYATGDRSTRRLPTDSRQISAAGAQATLNGFLDECDRKGPSTCAFANGGSAKAKWDQLLARLKVTPLVLPSVEGKPPVSVTYAGLLSFTLGALYAPPDQWGQLAEVFETFFVGTDQAALLEFAKVVDQQSGQLANFADQFLAVNCADTDNPRNPRTWLRATAQDIAKFGPIAQTWSWNSLACATWPVKDAAQYRGPWDAHTAVPVLVVNNLFDPATPYETAVTLAEQLGDARLLTVAGYGHVSYRSSSCSRAAIDRYLIDGTLPLKDTVCNQDPKPFDPPPAPTPTSGDPMMTPAPMLEFGR